jgi:hypothetical protein
MKKIYVMKKTTINFLNSIVFIAMFPYVVITIVFYYYVEFLSQAYDDIIKPLK